jgi:hypothetical protein
MIAGHGVDQTLAFLQRAGGDNVRRDVMRVLVVVALVGICAVQAKRLLPAQPDELEGLRKFYRKFYFFEDEPKWVERERRLLADPRAGRMGRRMRDLVRDFNEADLKQWRRDFPDITTAVDLRKKLEP